MSRKFGKMLASALVLVATPCGFTFAAAQAGIPGSTAEVNVDARGVGLGGYDPVAYFDTGKPTHGMATLSASYGGATYFFATAAHRAAFLKNPATYVPEFGGYCVVGASFGKKVDVDPETGKVVNGKLYLNNSQRALDIFDKDQAGTIDRAQANWPEVKDAAL
jgi:YHS domain-containing protein